MVRTFSVRDAMILVAAAAVGAYGYRTNDAMMTEGGVIRFVGNLGGWEILLGPGLAALTAGLVLARLLSPRPTRVELFRQPGFVAACVALAVSAKCFLYAMLQDWMIPFDSRFLEMEWENSMEEASLGIVTAWTVLALAGSLKAERGWIDRALRAMAMLWVVAGIAPLLVHYTYYAWFEGP